MAEHPPPRQQIPGPSTLVDTAPVAAALAAVRAGELGTVFAVHLELALDVPMPTACELAADAVLRLLARPVIEVSAVRSAEGGTVASSWSLTQGSATVTVTSARWAGTAPVLRLRLRGTRASMTADLASYEQLRISESLPRHPDAERVADLLHTAGATMGSAVPASPAAPSTDTGTP